MELMLNELSIHGQFYDPGTLGDALNRIMAMKKLADEFDRVLYCRKGILYTRHARPGTPLIEVLPREQISAIRRWLDTSGPFWEDDPPNHDSGDLFGCNNDDITGSGLAESAYCNSIEIDEIDRRMVSVCPSEWNYTPLTVNWLKQNGAQEEISVRNYWDYSTLKAALDQSSSPPESWSDVEESARQRFVNLNFTPDSFSDLKGRPFNKGVADRILKRLDVLDRLQKVGPGSTEGRQLLTDYFAGGKAWFSDSSDSEKQDPKFRRKATFNLADPNANPFCTWHGKVNTPPYRIHFTWPVPPGGQLYVVYIGWHM